MKLVVLISAYLEGDLVHGAIASALKATDDVIVFEGPAGPPLAGIPDTDYGRWDGRVEIQRGTWRTDARKRTAMVEACRKRFGRDEAVYGVWLDGDEILVNGEYLRDELQAWMWDDELHKHEDGWVPLIAWPMLLVERDGGGVVVCRGKCVRIDLIDRYSISSNIFVNHLGLTESHHGNIPIRMSDIELAFAEQLQARVSDPQERRDIADQLREIPPLPCQPFLLHRSSLRHPARRGLRLHEQEAVEMEKAEQTDDLAKHP